MLKKEFKRRDVERIRNLIKGNANNSSESQIGYKKKSIEYKEGDVWTENRKTWTIKNGVKQTVSKLAVIRKSVFLPLSCPKCKKIMKHHLDKNNYKIHKKCHSCVIKFEHDLMVKDKTLKLYKNYKNNLKTKNTITSLNEIESYLLDAMNNTSNSSFVSEHGIIERWVGGRPKEENFEEVTKNIDKVKKEQKNQLKNEK